MRQVTGPLLMIFAAVLLVCSLSGAALAETAKIHLVLYKAGFIVGVSGGRGTLYFEGKKYPLSIGGVSLGATIGASKAELLGTASNLHDPSDIEGTYSAVEAGAAVAGGAKVASLHNSRGAVLKVKGKQIGFIFSIDLSGMQVALKK
jgi:hypothetical protein